jgi:hypothetical protein
MTPWRVWFSAVGASQEPRRPWAVMAPSGALYLAANVGAKVAQTTFSDEAYRELPGGPRGVLECDDVVMVDAVPWGQS